MGGADTGANLAASGLSGLPMSGEPGGNAASVGAGTAAGASFAESARVTWPNALAPNKEIAAPASNTRRPTELKNIDPSLIAANKIRNPLPGNILSSQHGVGHSAN
jgi:hypothetical protein